MSNGWIPVAERLPGHREFIESYDPSNFGAEFLVTIAGADRATTLYYSLTGRWYDEQGKSMYAVSQPETWQSTEEVCEKEEASERREMVVPPGQFSAIFAE